MKISNKCPKCGSSEIIIAPGKKSPAESGRFIMTGLTTLSGVLFDRYVCSDCGYSEEYFDRDNTQKLIDQFDINN